jgi:cytochrome P450
MIKYPAVQARAQAELDAFLGPGRLPDFADREHLPYVTALVAETLRWITAVPLAVPHTTTHDDIYRGYFIPRGTAVMQNTWYLKAHSCCRRSLVGLIILSSPGPSYIVQKSTKILRNSGLSGF